MIFKELDTKDKILRRKVDTTEHLFANDVALLSKSSDGWSYTKNDSYTDDPLVTGSVLFVENNSFYITYANEDEAENDQFLGWNSIMSTIGADWDRENEEYDFFVSGQRINEVIAISFNPDLYNDAIDFDNFYVTMSGSTGNDYTTHTAGTYDVAESLVLAPYYLKSSIDDEDSQGDSTSYLYPAYELRTSDSNAFLSFDEATDGITIDWTQGNVSGVLGVAFVEVGLILLFPQFFGRTQITNAIRQGDRTVNSLNSIMDIAGYSIKRVEKTIVFSRLFSFEGNYPTNPTAFVKRGSQFVYRNPLLTNMRSFITKIGFYNDKNECLAVANLSSPIEKKDIDEKSFKIEIEN